MPHPLSVFIIAFFATTPLVVHAYIGPGLGLNIIGAVLGILLSSFLAIVSIFWYPIKKQYRKIKSFFVKK